MMSPGLQAGVYLQVTSSKAYSKPAKDWLEHQTTTLTPSRTTAGTIYSGKVATHAWTYTVPADATLTSICVGIAAAIAALAVPGFVPMVQDGPLVQCDCQVGTRVVFSDASQYLTQSDVVNVQESILTRGKLVLQVQVKSLESTDTTWSLAYLENVSRNIWSEVSLSWLNSLGLGLISVGDIQDHSAPIDQREASIGTVDLQFSFVERRIIAVDVGTIEHVSGLAAPSFGAIVEQVPFQADKPAT
jgi:hypothetical protein